MKFLAVLAAVVVAATAVVVPVTLRLLRDDDAVAADLEDDLRGRSDAPLTVTRTANGAAVRSVGTRAGSPIRVGGTDPAGTFLDRYGRLLGADRADLVPIGDEPLLGGGTATRYQQTIDDVPVLGGELSVQVDADGGVLSSLADLSRGGSGVDTTPTVRPVAARRAAVAATARAVDADPSTLSASAPEPWIYDPSVIGPPSPLAPRLTWRVEVTSTTDPVRQLVLVDAEDRHDRPVVQRAGASGSQRKVCDAANTRQAQPCTAPVRRGSRASPVSTPAPARPRRTRSIWPTTTPAPPTTSSPPASIGTASTTTGRRSWPRCGSARPISPRRARTTTPSGTASRPPSARGSPGPTTWSPTS